MTRYRNWVFLLSLVIGIAALSTPAQAQTDVAREFKVLVEQHEKAVATAMEPLNRRQAAALDAIMRRAMQANDQNTVAKIRVEMLKLGITAPGAAMVGTPGSDEFRRAALRAQLRDSRWSLGADKSFTLNADGTTTANWHNKHGSWKVIAPDKAEMIITTSLTVHIATFNADASMASMAEDKGGVLLGTAQRITGAIAKGGP